MTDYIALASDADLSQYVDKKVSIEGSVSQAPWQHMMLHFPDKPVENYFDLETVQIIVYSEKELPLKKLRIFGTVVKLEGDSKRPGTKIDDPKYVEFHIVADKWEIIGENEAPHSEEKFDTSLFDGIEEM